MKQVSINEISNVKKIKNIFFSPFETKTTYVWVISRQLAHHSKLFFFSDEAHELL